MSADLVKGVVSSGIQVHFMLLKFKNHLKLKYLACSDIYFIQLLYCNTIQDTHFSYGQTLFVSCMLPWQPLRHKDYLHFKNQVRPLYCMFYHTVCEFVPIT